MKKRQRGVYHLETIGIIGAGVMGIGVAHNYALEGYNVILIDIDRKALEEAERQIHSNVRLYSMYNRELGKSSPDEVLNNTTFTTDLEKLENVTYVIENITEDWDKKKKLYSAALYNICSSTCIIAANTSCISISKIASLIQYPENVIGTHYMNPVPLKPSVEVIKGYHTSETTIKRTVELLASINKKAIIINDFPGFVSNRISHLFMNEAAFVVQDQVADPRAVDAIFKECYGHKMGPLETADLIGIDTVVDSLDVLYESFQDTKFRCCPLLRMMVDQGRLGKKSGEGFYNYSIKKVSNLRR
jgi:3-hydroxybutyryl-CoA dehydrogenase